MKKIKIVLIGAGSVVFGMKCIRDAFGYRELWGSELVLVDLDAAAVERMGRAAERINQHLGAGFRIGWTTDRKEALPGADYVIVSIAVNRMEMWKLDFQVPQKYGINHVLGENGGPGALFHTLRNIPIMLDICRDIEQLCPEALMLNFTNPESRLCMAMNKYTKVKAVGLCHQINAGIKIVSAILDKPREEIDVKAWGLNHFTWMFDIRDKVTGEDLYPLFREKEKTYDPEFQKLSRFVFHSFGLFPTSGDGHLGEFFPYAHEFMSTQGYNFDGYERQKSNGIEFIENIANGTQEINNEMLKPSGEMAFEIIKSIECNGNTVIKSANLQNRGYISNLPADATVEVPIVVSGFGVQGVALGRELPTGIASLLSAQVNVQRLAVDAGVHGDPELVLQALLADPNVPSAQAAKSIMAELMEVNKPYLPQFS